MSEAPLVITHGSKVVMHFSVILEDGTVADSSEGYEPLTFVMGDGTLAEGLELALYGLKEGEKQSLKIDPENAYGFPDPNNVHMMERADFPEDMTLEKGVIIEFDTPAGDAFPGMIKEVDQDKVTVDFNHPLAGHEILFEVEILSIEAGDDTPVTIQ
jgi:FKBP-type peptidyl-prolyl cis-trans isomerase SlpA